MEYICQKVFSRHILLILIFVILLIFLGRKLLIDNIYIIITTISSQCYFSIFIRFYFDIFYKEEIDADKFIIHFHSSNNEKLFDIKLRSIF